MTGRSFARSAFLREDELRDHGPKGHRQCEDIVIGDSKDNLAFREFISKLKSCRLLRTVEVRWFESSTAE